MEIQIKIDVSHFIQNTPDWATAAQSRCRLTCVAPAGKMKKNPSVDILSNAACGVIKIWGMQSVAIRMKDISSILIEIASVVRGSKQIRKKIDLNQRSN